MIPTTLEPSPPPPVDRQKLWGRYQKSGPGSAPEEDLIQLYLPLVKHVVSRISLSLPPHIEPNDLYSAGLIGLLDAVRRFKTAAGVAFETYARFRIRGAILDELRKVDWVPRSIHEKARKVEETIHRLEQTHGQIPTDLQIAKELNMSLSEYNHLQDEIRPASFVCLDSTKQTPENPDGPSSYESISDPTQLDPGQKAIQHELAGLIAERLEALPDIQRKVLALYYFEDLRLREIAAVFGVTESRICQIHSQAIRNIKAYLLKNDSSVI